jgi:hypothetical protein
MVLTVDPGVPRSERGNELDAFSLSVGVQQHQRCWFLNQSLACIRKAQPEPPSIPHAEPSKDPSTLLELHSSKP